MKSARTPLNSETGKQLLEIENARADLLASCIQFLHQRGHHEAATTLGELWDQPPKPVETEK